MKKTMFITSVIMVIVMAIALTTSSLAWFSASGSQTVTTNSLKVTAKAEGATGIGISQTGEDNTWVSALDLDTTGNTNLMPLVPFAKSATPTADDLLVALVGGHEIPYVTKKDLADDHLKYTDGESTTVSVYDNIYLAAAGHQPTGITYTGGAAAEYYTVNAETGDITYVTAYEDFFNDLVSNGYISDQNVGTSAVAGADYAAYMIGAKIDNNKKFTDGADHTEGLYRNGFYTNTFYLQNLATGTQAGNITVDTSISFLCDIVEQYVDTNDNNATKYRVISDGPYSTSTRSAEKYALDPTLCVAVIMRTNGRMSDAQYVQYKPLAAALVTLLAAVPADTNDSGYDDAKAAADAKQFEVNAVKYTPAFSKTATYAQGDYVWYEGKCYKANSALAAGDFAIASFTLVFSTDTNDTVDEDDAAAFKAFINEEVYGASAYEIVAYAESKGAANTYAVDKLKMGKQASDFEMGDNSASSTGELLTSVANSYNLNKTNTYSMRGEHTYRYEDGEGAHTITVPADVLEVKVVAWYDATTLNNNNSQSTNTSIYDLSTGSADLKFSLKFSTH